MKIEDFKPGMYKLSQTVKNPLGKERNGSPNWRRHSSWDKGAKFIALDVDGQLCIYRLGSADRTLPIDSPSALAIIEYLTPNVEKPSDWLCTHVKTNAGFLALEVLDRLVLQGKVTAEDIKEQVQAYEQEDDA